MGIEHPAPPAAAGIEQRFAIERAEALRDLEHTITRRLAETQGAAEALRSAIRAVCESQRWECGRYFAWDETAGVLRFAGSWHIAEPVFDALVEKSRDVTYTPGAGLIGQAFQSGRPMWIRDMATDSRGKAGIARASGMHAALLIPTVSEGRPIGVLMVYSREIREHDQRLTESIHIIGSQIGQFLQRKRAEEARIADEARLRESEARFRSLTELSSDWYWEQDEHYRFTKFEGAGMPGAKYDATSVLLGRTAREIPGVM